MLANKFNLPSLSIKFAPLYQIYLPRLETVRTLMDPTQIWPNPALTYSRSICQNISACRYTATKITCQLNLVQILLWKNLLHRSWSRSRTIAGDAAFWGLAKLHCRLSLSSLLCSRRIQIKSPVFQQDLNRRPTLARVGTLNRPQIFGEMLSFNIVIVAIEVIRVFLYSLCKVM